MHWKGPMAASSNTLFLSGCGVCWGEEPAKIPCSEGSEPWTLHPVGLGMSPHLSEGLGVCVYYLTVTPAGKGASLSQGRFIFPMNETSTGYQQQDIM